MKDYNKEPNYIHSCDSKMLDEVYRQVFMLGYEQAEKSIKDALLEWAKDEHDSGPIKDSADNGDAWSIGYLCGMADIIMKLNSL